MKGNLLDKLIHSLFVVLLLMLFVIIWITVKS